MPVLPNSMIQARDGQLHQLAKRNFASDEPGVILVFCIVGTVAILLIGLFANKKLQARRAAKQ